MVWTGLHGLVGIGIALATQGRTILDEVGTPTMRFGLFWSLPGVWAYLDQTLDFLFAAVFFFALHRLAKKYQMRSRLLIPAAIASIVAFLVMVAYDLTEPSAGQWLLVYAGVGLPFLLLILLLPWLNRRIIYSIPVRSEHQA